MFAHDFSPLYLFRLHTLCLQPRDTDFEILAPECHIHDRVNFWKYFFVRLFFQSEQFRERDRESERVSKRVKYSDWILLLHLSPIFETSDDLI